MLCYRGGSISPSILLAHGNAVSWLAATLPDLLWVPSLNQMNKRKSNTSFVILLRYNFSHVLFCLSEVCRYWTMHHKMEIWKNFSSSKTRLLEKVLKTFQTEFRSCRYFAQKILNVKGLEIYQKPIIPTCIKIANNSYNSDNYNLPRDL